MTEWWSRLSAGLLLAVSMSVCAADFELKDISGKSHRLADYRGKWVLVNFWATWCPPCLNEMPELVSLHSAHKDHDLVVIGVALDSTRASVVEFAAKENISYPLVLGNHRMAAQIGEVEVLPTSFLYAPNGKLVASQSGEVTRESIESYIRDKRSN
ncbi:MAG TPA: TlpA disulfide reductase family protein [Gallionella sp.]|nr:TlpA disulfide reductase family protein [Gallionella sp.]